MSIEVDQAAPRHPFGIYPPDGTRLVRGDPWTITVDILHNGTLADTTGWTWRAPIRRSADSPHVAEFTVETGLQPPETLPGRIAASPCRVRLTLSPADSRNVPNGAVTDLEQLAPDVFTWWSATLAVTADVGY